MARIRTVKPEFFRHEKLQDLEVAHADLRPMLVFEALWLECDKQGVFPWRPRSLSHEILPIVWEATGKHLGSTLEVLWKAKLLSRFVDGDDEEYGFIPTFPKHQRIGGRELQGDARYPSINEMREMMRDGSTAEAPGKQPGSDTEAQRKLLDTIPEAPGSAERINRKGIGTTGSTGEVHPDRKHIPPAKADVRTYWLEAKLAGDPEAFFDHFTSNGWKVGGKTPMKDWEASARNWSRNDRTFNGGSKDKPLPSQSFADPEVAKRAREKRVKWEAEARAKAEAGQEPGT